MAKFSKNVLTAIAGFDGQILAQELVYAQKDFWNLAWTTTLLGVVTPVDLTGCTVDAQIVRRTITNLEDTRTGLSFDIADYSDPQPTAVDLTITNLDEEAGTFTMILDDDTWGVIGTDPELNIAVNNPVCFSGRIKVSFPVIGTQPAYDEVIFLLFLITGDGVVN